MCSHVVQTHTCRDAWNYSEHLFLVPFSNSSCKHTNDKYLRILIDTAADPPIPPWNQSMSWTDPGPDTWWPWLCGSHVQGIQSARDPEVFGRHQAPWRFSTDASLFLHWCLLGFKWTGFKVLKVLKVVSCTPLDLPWSVRVFWLRQGHCKRPCSESWTVVLSCLIMSCHLKSLHFCPSFEQTKFRDVSVLQNLVEPLN